MKKKWFCSSSFLTEQDRLGLLTEDTDCLGLLGITKQWSWIKSFSSRAKRQKFYPLPSSLVSPLRSRCLWRRTLETFYQHGFIFLHFETNQILHCLFLMIWLHLLQEMIQTGAIQDRMEKNLSLNAATARQRTVKKCKQIWRFRSNESTFGGNLP